MAGEISYFERTQILDVLKSMKQTVDDYCYSLWLTTGHPIGGKYVKTLNLADIPAGGITITDVLDVENGWPKLRLVHKLNNGTIDFVWMEFVVTDNPDLFTVIGEFIAGSTQIKVISHGHTINLCKAITSA